jgi:hypothetical protein
LTEQQKRFSVRTSVDRRSGMLSWRRHLSGCREHVGNLFPFPSLCASLHVLPLVIQASLLLLGSCHRPPGRPLEPAGGQFLASDLEPVRGARRDSAPFVVVLRRAPLLGQQAGAQGVPRGRDGRYDCSPSLWNSGWPGAAYKQVSISNDLVWHTRAMAPPLSSGGAPPSSASKRERKGSLVAETVGVCSMTQ